MGMGWLVSTQCLGNVQGYHMKALRALETQANFATLCWITLADIGDVILGLHHERRA